MRAVAITGAGAVTGLGGGADLWARYRGGDRAARQVPPDTLDALPDAVRARAARVERVAQLALAAAAPALAGAGLLVLDGPPRPGLGVVLGTGFGCFLTNAAYQRRLVDGGLAGASPRLFAATVSNAAAGEVGIAYRLGGPAITLTAGGAAGLAALGHAVDQVRREGAEAVLAGGVDALGDELVRWLVDGGLDLEAPPGEAAALVVLERVAAARARGAAALATVEGHAAGFEPAGGPEGLARAIAAALADAGLPPAAVDVVVSATAAGGGASEEAALRAALGAPPRRSIVPKAVFGDTVGAAGPLGLLAALAEAPRGALILVLDACPSGHVGALLARAGAPS